jgi:intracellular protein transport protein USO1
MLPPEDAGLLFLPSVLFLTHLTDSIIGTHAHSPVTPLLFGLIIPPSSPLDRISVSSVQFAAVLFAHLLRHAPRCKDLARKIVPPPFTPLPEASSATPGGTFFVPADGEAPADPPEPAPKEDNEDGPQSLLALLTEHLSLAFLQRSRTGLSPREAREADRVLCAYLALLAQWLWEDPRAVREFLEAGGLGVLVEQLNQPSEIDVVVPGLCAFLLGVYYEFNREPGEITRWGLFTLSSPPAHIY